MRFKFPLKAYVPHPSVSGVGDDLNEQSVGDGFKPPTNHKYKRMKKII